MILQLFDAASSTYTYIVADRHSGECAIIDPVLGQADRDLGELARHRLRLRWILDTHVHADHETGANALKAAVGGTTAVGAQCGSVGHDQALEEGDKLELGERYIRVITTPGHTPGSVTYLWKENAFTGDALLIEGCGRTDFQDGSSDALYDSVTRKLFALPDETLVWPAHDYRARGSSTIGHEKKHNPRLAGKSRDEFRAIMAGLNLAPPGMIDRAVPANRAGGALHAGEAVPAMVMARDLEKQFDPAQDGLADLRNEAEFIKDSLPDAIRVNYGDIASLTSMAARHRKLFIICRSGRMSLQAADALLKVGVKNACHVTGGMLALRANEETQAH